MVKHREREVTEIFQVIWKYVFQAKSWQCCLSWQLALNFANWKGGGDKLFAKNGKKNAINAKKWVLLGCILQIWQRGAKFCVGPQKNLF